jgi:hypothetical protein
MQKKKLKMFQDEILLNEGALPLLPVRWAHMPCPYQRPLYRKTNHMHNQKDTLYMTAGYALGARVACMPVQWPMKEWLHHHSREYR